MTLIELIVTVSVIAILLSLAIPSYQEMTEKRRLRGAAETLFAELQFVKMESIKSNTSVRVDFEITNASTWCYGVSTVDCKCTEANSCLINNQERVIRSTDYRGIKLEGNPWSGAASFTPTRSTVASGGATFYSEHYAVRVTTSGLGRIKICNATGMPKPDFGGYPSC